MKQQLVFFNIVKRHIGISLAIAKNIYFFEILETWQLKTVNIQARRLQVHNSFH